MYLVKKINKHLLTESCSTAETCLFKHFNCRHLNIGSLEVKMAQAIDITEKFSTFSDHWRPKIAAELNGQTVRLVKVLGVFPWHSHKDAEEMFMVWKGVFRVEFRDKIVVLNPGQFVVVPRGVEHRTGADEEAEVIIFEPADVVNTGDAEVSEFTAPQNVKI